MHYFESDDLKKFGEVGKFSGDLMKKFFTYYNASTSEEGALLKR